MRNDPGAAQAPLAGLASAKGFLQRLTDAPQAALLLDYDGTLAPFREDRNQAEPYEGVRERLGAILQQGRTHVAVVTGRIARDVDARLQVRPRPAIWGSHGFEEWPPDQEVRSLQLGSAHDVVVDREFEWARGQGWGDHVERKPIGVALHWRGVDEATRQQMKRATGARWAPTPSGFGVHPFDGGVELRTGVATKARAVEETRRRLGPDVPIAYLGDDLTDEDAFRALSSSDLGVLVRHAHRATAASVWLRPPEDLVAFLDAWRDARHIPNR